MRNDTGERWDHRLILTGGGLYRELELTEDVVRVAIGTEMGSDMRFQALDFFEPFSFCVTRSDAGWQIECGEGVYVSGGDVRKLMVCPLTPGGQVSVRYRSSNAELLRVRLAYSFRAAPKNYDRFVSFANLSSVTLGGTNGAQIQLHHTLTQGDVCMLTRQADGWTLQAVSSRTGVFLNGRKVTGSVRLQPMDFIDVGPFSFCWKDGGLYTAWGSPITLAGISYADYPESRSALVYPQFNRGTRIHIAPSTEEVQVLDPPTEPQEPERDIIAQLFPAIAMIAIVVLVRGSRGGSDSTFLIMSVASMGVGIASSIYSLIKGRSDYKKKLQERSEAYSRYIVAKRAALQQFRQEEAQILEETYYPAERELLMIDEFDERLFERTAEDGDFLEVRLGTGERESVRKTAYRQKEQVEATDTLQDIPASVDAEFKMLHGVPVTLSLKNASIVGITGGRGALAHMLRVLTLDLVTRQYHTDVQLFYCLDETDTEMFSYLKYLPHVRNNALHRRNIICDDESKSVLLEYLYKLMTSRDKDHTLPRLVVFMYRDRGIRSHPLSQLMEQGKKLGVTFLFFEEEQANLPTGCEYVIQMNSEAEGALISSADGTSVQPFVTSDITDAMMLPAARKLAPVHSERISLESTLTRNITLFELLNIYGPEDLDLEKNWAASEVYRSMAAPLGVKSKNQIISLDLHEKAHGPHGLVAGTTGSGKSELLQSYVLSMALRFHPYEVGFVIIDFKGGGMVNQFRDLPHLVGAITNIDGREIDRSLLSIRAELKKRQELFAQYNVNHIDSYIRLFRKGETPVPLPHLILIVDEFAELKMDQPEFMKELISTARIGRSLGVHLILATQKPSGVVDPQIWSNSRFKLCLKVQSKEDSNEVLKTPLAAEIQEPGRAYLQVGNNEVFELFQSAYSGGPAKVEGVTARRKFKISRVSFSGRRTLAYEQKPEASADMETTQLQSVVRYVAEYTKRRHIARLPFICLPPLPERLPYEPRDFGVDIEEGLSAALGIYDDPSRQYQGEFSINVTQENTLIIGSSQYGKTNLLQTVVRSLTEQYTPEQLNLYILDFGTMIFTNFEDLAHVGGVVCSQEDEKLKNLFRLLNEELASRKEKLVQAGVSSFASYLEAGLTELPQIVVIIDNLTALREMYLTDSDFLLPLCRDGLSVGISFVAANNQTGGFGYRYLTNFGKRIALFCNDSAEYNALFGSSRVRPRNTPGRCLVEQDKTIYEAQVSLAFDGEKEIQRVGQIRQFVQEQNSRWTGPRARRIPMVPETVTAEVLERDFQAVSSPEELVLGVDYATVAAARLSLTEGGYLGIAGKDELGRAAFVAYLVGALEKSGARLFVLDSLSGALRSVQDGAQTYSRSLEDLPEMLAEVRMCMEERARRVAAGGQSALAGEPAVALVLGNPDAVDAISGDKTMLAHYKDLVGKYRALRMCVIFTDLNNAPIPYGAPEVLKMMKNARRFLLFEEASDIKLTDLTTTTLRRFKKPLTPGDAYFVTDTAVNRLRTAVPDRERMAAGAV